MGAIPIPGIGLISHSFYFFFIMLPEPAPFTSKATGWTYRHPSDVGKEAQQKIRNNKEDCINIIKWAKQWEDYKNQVVKIEVDVKARKIVVVNEDEWKEREVRRKMRESIDKSKETKHTPVSYTHLRAPRDS